MPTIKLVVLPAKILTNGKHKVRISIAHQAKTKYIPTDCIINNLSQFKDGQVVNRPDASHMNMRLRKMFNHYQEVIDSLIDVNAYSCSTLRDTLLTRKDYSGTTFMQAAEEYLCEVAEDKRVKSERLYRLAAKSFLKSTKSDLPLSIITPRDIKHFEAILTQKELSNTTIKIYLTLVKVIINYTKKRKMVIYDTDPFEFCRMPSANIRELDLTIEEIKAIRDLEIKEYNIRTVRNTFMLSYYLGGINFSGSFEY